MKVNMDKTDILILHSDHLVRPLTIPPLSSQGLLVGPILMAMNLSILVDPQLLHCSFVNVAAKVYNFQFANNHKICHFPIPETTRILVHALVVSHLDDYNSLLADVPPSLLHPFTLVQNSTYHITPIFSTIILHYMSYLSGHIF
ncbi:hypothetical protein JRQ81_017216 [Phrynocephalus forsythii]|uniref:Reverse transcriptase domain-containing protein n=1 Tax=Phrynocephalus forsythii TaxID=171643 RepID=A0A9Q0XPX2_9SAUR|nr:hypothetical protein JRQ81_017216 [Phrynocephalus forsythii]